MSALPFEQALFDSEILLCEGSMYDRLKRLAGEYFDPELGHLGLIYSDAGRSALEKVYSEYINAAVVSNRRILIFSPTWRGNSERINRSKLRGHDVNRDGVKFVLELRGRSDWRERIFVGALVGCRGDCYDAKSALAADAAREFHRSQIAALADAGPDFLFASTLPATEEALGIGSAMAETELPYLLSFVTDGSGRVLDGGTISQTIERIDAGSFRGPTGYAVNCIHPTVFRNGLKKSPQDCGLLRDRLIGFQGNTSRADPRSFDSLPDLDTEPPQSYALACLALFDSLSLRYVGGCCGTGPEHIEGLGRELGRLSTT